MRTENETLPLTQKALKTLLFLIENQSKIVEREELLNAVWEDAIVEENILSVNVSNLRKIFKDNGGGKFIKTYPRKGYKFVADIEEILPETRDDILILEQHTKTEITIENTDDENDLPKAYRPQLPTKARRNLKFYAAGLLALLFFGVVFAFWWRSTDPAESHINSIAILPLKAIGENENDQALGVGIADSLIMELGRTKKITVRPTSSIMRFAEIDYDSREIGIKLNVDAILEGTFQHSDGKFRINAKLIRIIDGEQIWAGIFDENEDEIFKLQDSLSAKILDSLRIRLSPEEEKLLSKNYTQNKEAYQYYLRGRYFFDKRSIENYQKAISEFQKALELDDKYALAHTGLADAYSLLGNNSREKGQRREYYKKAKRFAQVALELDPNLSEAYTSLGWIKRNYEWDWEGAEEAFRKAIELNSNNVNAQRWYGLLLTNLGRTDVGIAQLKIAQQLDPLSAVVNSHLAWMLYLNRQYVDSVDQLNLNLQLHPNHLPSRRLLVSDFLMQEKFSEALKEIEKIPDTPEHRLHVGIMNAIAQSGLGDKANAQSILDEIVQNNMNNSAANYYLAIGYTEFGQYEKALDRLERALENKDDRLVWIKVQPEFEELRAAPRFKKIIQTMNL